MWEQRSMLLERCSDSWLVDSPPIEFRERRAAHSLAADNEFIVWGGSSTEIEGAMSVAYFDGATYAPKTAQWRMIPSVMGDVSYSLENAPSSSTVWTASGLFVWGTLPDRSVPWGAILDIDSMQWTSLRTEGSDVPPVLVDAYLLTVGGDVFLHGGRSSGSEDRSRRMWRYSLSQELWKEVTVPDWADPAYPGAVVDEKLVFLGRCKSGARYDPKADTWHALTTEGGPPSMGRLWGVGDFLAVTDTYYGETETDEVWLLDLRETQ